MMSEQVEPGKAPAAPTLPASAACLLASGHLASYHRFSSSDLPTYAWRTY